MSSDMEASAPTDVLLFRDDFDRIRDWVLQYPDSETGGQFFGLWSHQKNPYVNIVIGPGKGCRHESHSFHQDIDYLKNVGTFLNKEFMMCHIGEWHSHHRLRLRQPSSGDLNSIWKHFPDGVEYFLLVIATIESDKVKLWPWLFSAATRKHTAIGVKIVEKDNAFMKDDVVRNKIASGAEKLKDDALGMSQVGKPWWHTDEGAHLVQYLNSELEKLSGRDVEKTFVKKRSALQLSFICNGSKCIADFPAEFPKKSATVTCRPRGCSVHPLEWHEEMRTGMSPDDFVRRIVEDVRARVPQ